MPRSSRSQLLPSPLPHYLPGLVLTGLLALAATALANVTWLQAHGLGALTLAIVAGIVLGNTVYPRWAGVAQAGVGVAKQWLLRAGIVLYGLRLTLDDIAGIGVAGVVLDALMLTSTFALACWLGRRVLKLDLQTVLLIGAGSSICGAAAVLASEPVVKARSEQVAVAVATVVIFGTLAMFCSPLLWHWGSSAGWLGLDASGFGLYTGATIHEVAQVVAAGRAVGPEAADTAVIAKMVRVMMLAPFLLALSLYLARRRGSPSATPANAPARLHIPWFAFGFLAMVGFNSLDLLPAAWVQGLLQLDGLLLAMAMAALGLTTHVSALRRAGAAPLLLALLLFVWLLAGGLALARAINCLW